MGPGTRRCRRLTCASQAARRSCRNTAIPLCLQTTREVATGRPAAGGGCPRARRRGLRHELVAEPSNGDFVLVFVALSNHDQSVVAGMALCLRLDYNDWHAARGRTGRGRGWRRNVSSPGCIGTSDPMARVPTGGSNSAPIQVVEPAGRPRLSAPSSSNVDKGIYAKGAHAPSVRLIVNGWPSHKYGTEVDARSLATESHTLSPCRFDESDAAVGGR